jgi:YesN/AraC family two-component response regulator
MNEFIKILIVDDNEDMREALILMLNFSVKRINDQLKFEIEESCNGYDAYQMASTKKYDFILSDFRMPNWDGEDLFENLEKSNIQCKKAILSGRVEIQYSLEYEDLRKKYKVFTKPANMMEITKYILCETGYGT